MSAPVGVAGPAGPARRRRVPSPGVLVLAALTYLPAAHRSTRAGCPPTPSCSCTSIPVGSSPTRPSAGTPASSPGGCRTRRSPICGRPARGSGSSIASACPTGSHTGCGSAPCCSSAASACAGRPAHSGSLERPPSVAGIVYALSPYILPYVSRTSVMLLPWAGVGGSSVSPIRATDPRHRWRDAGLFGSRACSRSAR